MIILDETLFFHINSRECTMLSSKLTTTDLFNNFKYAHLTEKIPAEDGIHLCLSSASGYGWNGCNRFSNSCSKAASTSESESFQSNLHSQAL
ncbi:hypothetical protein QL285_016287 [Trifolium repens]|nr:hypothetical protein QL285_016287 [Trifolium repens]